MAWQFSLTLSVALTLASWVPAFAQALPAHRVIVDAGCEDWHGDAKCPRDSSTELSLRDAIEHQVSLAAGGSGARFMQQVPRPTTSSTTRLRRCTSPRKGLIVGAAIGAAAGVAGLVYITSNTFGGANVAIWTGFVGGGAAAGAYIGHRYCS